MAGNLSFNTSLPGVPALPMGELPLPEALVGWFPPVVSSLDWRTAVAASLALYMLYEQISFLVKRGPLPGPSLAIPFVGSVIAMVANPTKYWDDQARAAEKMGLSWNALLGRYCVFVRDSELSHAIFANVHPQGFNLIGHPLGRKLFGENNMIMMQGDLHKDLRRRLAPLFTHKALGMYIAIQERTIRDHMRRWLARAAVSKDPVQMRYLLRDLNLETSQTVFAGPYLSAKARKAFTHDYYLFNVGLLALPINLPGFSFWKASRAVQRIIRTLADCARQSKERMAGGGAEPECLLDFWMAETLRECREAAAAGAPPPPHSSDLEVGQHLFDFLFAAQDASTSSLVWAVALLESHPEVLAKVREEVRRVQPDGGAPYTSELLRGMPYLEMVVREVLRYRPPATMVPHIAAVDFPLTPEYTVPKGTIVFPSLLESSFQGFTDPHRFDPERFSPARREDQLYRRNWLLFGAGPHQCLGQRYAINHIALFVALMATTMEWTREDTPDRDALLYVPTIIPKDGALVRLSSPST